MFVLLGLSGEKKSFLAFSNNFRHLFFLIQIMIIFGYISKYNHICHTKIQLITLRLHSPLCCHHSGVCALNPWPETEQSLFFITQLWVRLTLLWESQMVFGEIVNTDRSPWRLEWQQYHSVPVYNAAECSYSIPPTILTCHVRVLQCWITQSYHINFPWEVSIGLCIWMTIMQPGDENENIFIFECPEAKNSHILTGLTQRLLHQQSLSLGFVRRFFWLHNLWKWS